MTPHNNELSDLHVDCTYCYDNAICKIIDLSKYPKVIIETNNGKTLEIDACDIYHIELNDAYLDEISSVTTVSVTKPKEWHFDDEIPIKLTR